VLEGLVQDGCLEKRFNAVRRNLLERRNHLKREVTDLKAKFSTLIIVALFIVSAFWIIPSYPVQLEMQVNETIDDSHEESIPDDIAPAIERVLSEDNPGYPASLDLNEILGERENTYRTIYEPWLSKAAIHAIAYEEETGFLALGGGYLYDNEVHLYRLNLQTGDFDKVWEIGDGVIESDVLSLDFGDTDLNDFIEIAVGSSDGHVYVFEQRHLYDPYANTENMFDLVWKSEGLFKVFAVKIDDIDRDYHPDIIVGSWDGYVHLYEYDNHSQYPFEEDHWISYEEVATLEVGEKIYSLETGDTNNNGLPEIVVGTREGRVFVFENGGVSLMINEQPFPLVRDNTYYLNWTSENYTWEPVRSIAIGELDSTPGDEIALVVEGQGVFTLDWDESKRTYEYKKVQRDYAAWESFGLHSLDYWADSIIYAHNVTYFDPVNETLVIDEPIKYEWNEALEIFLPNASVYPYNTGMAQASDGNYSTFDAALTTVDNATAIIDFGLDEEGTGSANSEADLIITFKENLDADVFTKLNFSIGQSASDFLQVNSSCFTIMPFDESKLMIDVDPVLTENQIDWFRYAKIVVFDEGNYSINSIELLQVYNLLTDALSLTIGPFRFDGDAFMAWHDEIDKIVVATVTGEFVVIEYNFGAGTYDIIWESYDDERFTLGANVWDIEHVALVENVPIWYDIGTLNYINPMFGNYNSWTYAIPAPITKGGDGSPFYLVGTDASVVRAVNMGGEEDFTMNGYLANINTGTRSYTSAELAWLWPTDPNGVLPTVVVGSFDPDGVYAEPSYWRSRANIDFFTRPSPFVPYTKWYDIEDLDVTGELTSLLSISKTTPKMDFEDFDGDGDLDFVLSNGYIYLAKNIFKESGYTSFILEQGFFEDINKNTGPLVWGQPELFDIDQDGDLDLILSYADRYGTTCFINEGTFTNPEWVEDRRLFANPNLDTSMSVLKLTDTRMVPNRGGYTLQRWADEGDVELYSDYSLAALQNDTKQLRWAIPYYDIKDSYVVATYPTVYRMDFCLMHGEGFRNLGFHIHNSWDTEGDLENWTLSITSGDTDGDGRGEIIVGDYDNNVYAFEHLTNNTYKRMFRSFDLNHSIKTDVSPYAYQQLEGISGEFYRKIFDHAKHLLTNVDLDQDGFTELVVASDLQVYIFEATGIDDTLEFAYTFDLRDLGYLDEEADAWEEVTEITAMDGGIDLDSDERLELVVAVGPFLFTFNINQDSFEGMENNDFFGMEGDANGRYFLIGNPESSSQYENADIRSLVVGDTDADGYLEVILGGVLDTSAMRHDGFAVIYECMGGTFQTAWQAPANVTNLNPISVIKIDDQDYDGYQEIIIAHSKGVDIFEYIPDTDSTYQLVETITSSPNYPTVPLRSYKPAWSETFTNRSANDMVWLKGPSTDFGFLIYVDDQTLTAARYNWSDDSWLLFGPALAPNSYQGGDITPETEYQPSLLATEDGIYMAWKMKRQGSSRTDFWVSFLNYTVGAFEPPVWIWNWTDTTGIRNHPEVFEYNSTHIGVMYNFEWADTNELYYTLINKSLNGTRDTHLFYYPDWQDYHVQKASVVNMPDGSFAVAMSAVNTKSSKGDFDIYTLYGNASFYFNNTKPHQATSSFYDELYPDIDYLWSDNRTLIVAYEVQGAPFENRIGMVSSTNNGSTWGRENNLNPYPDYLVRQDFSTYYMYTISGIPYTSPNVYSPSVLGMKTGGYMYLAGFITYQAATNSPYADFLYGINPSSDWAYNDLHDIENLAVGDTDSDGRKEIVVTYGDQYAIYELLHSNDGEGNMTYVEAYLSNSFENPITGVTIYDSNNNGWEEIGISCERGDVFIQEYRDPSHGPTKFSSSQQTSQLDLFGGPPFITQTGDVDADSKEEMVVALISGAGTINFHLFDDDGSIVWNHTYPFALWDFELSDIDNDDILEIVATQWGQEFLLAFNSSDGALLWNCTTLTDDVQDYRIADINRDGLSEIVVATEDNKIWIINNTGEVWHSEIVDTGTIWGITVGDFNDNDTLGVAYGNGTYAVKVINPLDGTMLYESPNNMVGFTGIQPMEAHDFNGDGYDDVIFGNNDTMRMVDVVTGTIFYNSSVTARLKDLIIKDFDGDNINELFALTTGDGAYLIEAGTLRTQWHYNPELVIPEKYAGFTISAVTGYFGGTGKFDIALNVDGSAIVVLDGKNGLPLWINFTDDIGRLDSADFDGNMVDSLYNLYWVEATYDSYLIGYDAIEISPFIPEPGYSAHEIYWEEGATVDSVWAGDINNDNYDEIFLAAGTDHHTLAIYQGRDADLLWKHSPGGSIELVRFGKLTSGLNQDFAILVNDSQINIYDSDSWSLEATIVAPHNFKIVDFYIAGFDMDPYDDIAVLFERKSPTNKAYVSWYESDGSWKYTSSVNSTDGGAHMAVGYFRGDLTPDVVYGGDENIARVLRGDNGQVDRSYNLYTNVQGIVAGYFDSDSDEDFALISSGAVTVVNGTNHSVYSVAFGGSSNFRGAYAADLCGDSDQELIVYNRSDSVNAYNSTGHAVWSYEAKLVFLSYSALTTCTFADFNNDGKDDLVLTNGEYLNVVDGANQSLLWHFVHKEDIFDPTVAVCVSTSGPPDVVAHDGSSVFVISGRLNPPPLPLMGAAAKGMSLSEIFIQSTIILFPIGLLISMPLLIVRKRRRSIEKQMMSKT
jgi:hypothetical protein